MLTRVGVGWAIFSWNHQNAVRGAALPRHYRRYVGETEGGWVTLVAESVIPVTGVPNNEHHFLLFTHLEHTSNGTNYFPSIFFFFILHQFFLCQRTARLFTCNEKETVVLLQRNHRTQQVIYFTVSLVNSPTHVLGGPVPVLFYTHRQEPRRKNAHVL